MSNLYYKSKVSKNGKWSIAFQKFSYRCKNLKLDAYKTGIRFWRDSFGTATLAFVVGNYRLMFMFPFGKEIVENG